MAIFLSTDSQKKICSFVDDAYMLSDVATRRDYMQWMDRQYNRRMDLSKGTQDAVRAAMNKDPTKYRNIVYPLVMPQVEAAVSYQTEVYCSGVPLFPVVSSPDQADAAAQLETVIDNNAQKGGWASEFALTFRDAFKYNRCGLLADWDIQMGPLEAQGNAKEQGANQRKVLWSGNKVKRLDMYNTFFDPRVAPSAVSNEGEFAGTIEVMSRTRLRRLLAELPDKYAQNEGAAFASSPKVGRFIIPNIGNSLYAKAVASEFSWGSYFQIEAMNSKGKPTGMLGDLYEVATCYVRICPIDFGIRSAAASLPQVFKVIIVNREVVIHFSAVSSNYSALPILICQAYEDGFGSDTSSMVENIEGMQQLASAFVNSAVAARRRAVSDRAIYNQSLIDPKDIASDNPVAKIPMKPSALLNRSAQEAYYPIPFNDNISGNAMTEASAIEKLSYGVSGQNPARQGQFVKGNKTRSEYNSVMDNSAARDKIVAMHFETRLFTPLKQILRYNTVRNQGPATLMSRDKGAPVTVTPGDLQAAVMEFKVGDGMMPSAKLADADTLQVMLQTIGTVPQLAQQYDLGKVYISMLQAGGVAIADYKYSPEQAQYNQAMQAWQQAAAQAAQAGAPFNVPMPVAPAAQTPTPAPAP